MAQQQLTPEEFAKQLGGDVSAEDEQLSPDDFAAKLGGTVEGGSRHPHLQTLDFLKDAALGVKAGAARTIFEGGDLIRRTLGMERVIDRPEVQAAMTAPPTTAGSIGKGVETVAEFIAPSGLARKGATTLLSKLPKMSPIAERAAKIFGMGAAEAGSTYAVSELQGVEHPGMAAATSAATSGLLAGGGAVAGAIYKSAERQMEKLLLTAAQGDEAAERAARAVLPLALDDTLLKLTKGRWGKAVQASKKQIGKSIGAVVAGPVGDELVPSQPLIDNLNALRAKAVNLAPANASGGSLWGQQLQEVPFNKRLIGYVDELKEIIEQHGPTVPLRSLVNLRRDWDEFVFSAKQFLNRDDLVKQYESRAKLAATDAIRGIIDKDPRLISLKDLDKSYHLHKQLYDLIGDAGLGKGEYLHYFPGWGLKGAVERRMFNAALNSPTWRLMSIATKKRLADFMAANNTGGVRQILGPIVAASTNYMVDSAEPVPSHEPPP